jgi:hypothetical protein
MNVTHHLSIVNSSSGIEKQRLAPRSGLDGGAGCSPVPSNLPANPPDNQRVRDLVAPPARQTVLPVRGKWRVGGLADAPSSARIGR